MQGDARLRIRCPAAGWIACAISDGQNQNYRIRWSVGRRGLSGHLVGLMHHVLVDSAPSLLQRVGGWMDWLIYFYVFLKKWPQLCSSIVSWCVNPQPGGVVHLPKSRG